MASNRQDKSKNRGRSSKRPVSNSGDSESSFTLDESHNLSQEDKVDKTRHRDRTLSKKRKMNEKEVQQPKITEFTNNHDKNTEEEKVEDQNSTLLLETMIRMEKKLENKTDAVKDQLDKVLSEIFEVRKENELLKRKLIDLEKKCTELEQEVAKANKKTDHELEQRNSLEQYTRKDNIKIINLPGDRKEETTEETEKKVVDIMQNKLGLKDFVPDNISTTHRIGKYNQGQNRPVIVRLIKRKDTTVIFKQKKLLKEEKIFIYEDLTKLNMQRLRTLKNHPAVISAWSYQGKLFCKLIDLQIICIEDGNTDQIDKALSDSTTTKKKHGQSTRHS